MEQPRISAKKLTYFAILLALVIVLQLLSTFGVLKISATPINLTLIPVVLGGMILGPVYGGLLGLAFGIVTLVAGITGADGFTFVLWSDHPILTALTCLLKGSLCGLISSFAYCVVAEKKKYLATFVASAVAPIVNTGLFILGALLMNDTISGFAKAEGVSVMYFLIIICAGVNFLIELGINLVVSPAIYRVSEIISKKKF